MYSSIIGPSPKRVRLTEVSGVRGAGLKRKAGLDTWRNAATKLTPSACAQGYITTMDCSLQGQAELVLSRWKAGEPRKAKALFEAVPLSEFTDSALCQQWLQFGALFLKSTDSNISPKLREEAAISGFLESNARCARFTKKLRFYAAHWDRAPADVKQVVGRAKRLIADFLPRWGFDVYEKLIALSRPGGGMTIGTRDPSATSPPFKYGYTHLCTTRSALPHARALVEYSPIWKRVVEAEEKSLVYRIVNYDRITTVPKDAVVDRTIGIGPALLVALQLGVHEFLAPLLKRRWGVTIDDQLPNSEAARAASQNWESLDSDVTIDIKDSSNSFCRGLIELMLPEGWLEYLTELRSPSFILPDGTTQTYEIWSCMGNGYTFVLQCMIYYALAEATQQVCQDRGRTRVYGDDIIVSRGSALLLIEVLKWLGIRTNVSKSHLFGPFRESCGGEFFAGKRVTPVYLRGKKQLRLIDVYKLTNDLFGGVQGLIEDPGMLSAALSMTLVGVKHPVVPSSFPSTAGLWGTPTDVWWSRREQCPYIVSVCFNTEYVRHDPTWQYCAALRGALQAQVFEDHVITAKRGRGYYAPVVTPLWGGGWVP